MTFDALFEFDYNYTNKVHVYKIIVYIIYIYAISITQYRYKKDITRHVRRV